jgi:hypothetical protein
MWDQLKAWVKSEKPVRTALLAAWRFISGRVEQEIEDRVDFDRDPGPSFVMAAPLRDQAERKVAAATALDVRFTHYAPRSWVDPRNLVDGRGLHPALNSVIVAGQLGDAGSTHYALGKGGAREGNPAVASLIEHGGIASLYAVKAATGIGMALIADHVASIGHPRAAKVLAFLGGAVPLAVAAHNVHVGRAR